MGNNQSAQKINFEDIQYAIKNNDNYLIVNTLNPNEQKCLIPFTINANDEENIINNFINNNNKSINIIVYGKNCNDETINIKYNQLMSLGFYNVFIYYGGMFEWLLLQDIYGKEDFPTTCIELDLLKYKANNIFTKKLLM